MKVFSTLSVFIFLAFISINISAAQETDDELVEFNTTAILALGLDDENNSTSNSSEETSTILIGFTTEPELNGTELLSASNETLTVEIEEPTNTTSNTTEDQPGNATELETETIHLARTQPLHLPPGQEQQLAETASPSDEAPTEEPGDEEVTATEVSSPETTEEPREEEDHVAEEDDETRRREEEETRRREEEETRRREEEDPRQTHHIESQDPQDSDPANPDEHDPQTAESLPPKESVQATFKFTVEKRCFDFLKRLKGKGRNEHSDHPLTCPAAFDGILCWRPADPGETLLQMCPDVPRQRAFFAKRHCQDGKWREYPDANSKLQLHEILHTSYKDCYEVPAFLRKHGAEPYRPAYTSAERLGPGVSDYKLETTPTSALAVQSTRLYSFVQGLEGEIATAAPLLRSHQLNSTLQSQDGNVLRDGLPARPWLAANDKDCQDFLNQHNLANTRGGTWCSGLSDGTYCWPATAPDTTPTQPCRPVEAAEDLTSGQTPKVSRHCNANGQWNTVGSDGTVDVAGWTNKKECNKAGLTGDHVAVAGLGGYFFTAGETTTLLSVLDEPATGSPMALTSNPENGTTHAARHTPKKPWLQSTKESCEQLLKDIAQLDETQPGSCRGSTDGNICWPTTPKDQTVTQPCPKIAGLDATKSVSRTCGSNGAWTDATGNYSDCFTAEIKDLIESHCSPRTSSAAVLRTMPWIIAANFLVFIFNF